MNKIKLIVKKNHEEFEKALNDFVKDRDVIKISDLIVSYDYFICYVFYQEYE